MSMYGRAGGQGAVPDTGLAMGAGLVDAELAARTHYARPTVPQEDQELRTGAPGAGRTDAPDYYNYQGGQPVKYDVPSAQKERMQIRSAVRQAAAKENANSNVMRTDPISDEEINYVAAMKDQAELADFDRYVNSLIDPRKPGNLKWLMEIYPEYVNRRIQQVHTDYEFALRNQMIDSWGINTFDDLHFKYLVDQGKVDGPRLGRHQDLRDRYAPGLLSPWSFVPNGDNRPGNLRLPFASATEGRRPAGNNPENWELDDSQQPLNTGRRTQTLADNLYKADPAGDFARSRRPTPFMRA